MNEYVRVIDGVIGDSVAYHGRAFEGKLWGKLATVEEYAADNLYLIVREDPEFDEKTERHSGFTQEVNEDLKQVIIRQTYEPIPDEEILATKKAELQATLQNTLSEGYMTSFGFRVDCLEQNVTDFAQSHQLMTIGYQAEPTVTIDVRDYNNQMHTLTYPEYSLLVAELGNHVMAERYKYWAAVDALNTNEEELIE